MEQRSFDGWKVVAAVFLMLVVNAGIGFYGLAIYLEALTDERGWTTGSVSLGTSIYFIVGGLVGRLSAPVIEKRDVRIVVAVGAVFGGLGMLLIGRASSLLGLYGAYTVFAVGAGLAGLVPATTLITRWFHRRRSIALSIASTGLSVGGLTLTLWIASLVDNRGMSDAAPTIALVYVIGTLLTVAFLYPDPAARGQTPDGDVVVVGAASDVPSVEYDVAIRQWFFRFMTLAFILAMASQVGGISQLAKLGSERIDRDAGALALSGVAIASVIGRLIGGVVATRVKLITMTTVLASVQALALGTIALVDTRTGLFAASILFGLTIGNLLMLQPLLVSDQWGVANYPRIFGLQQLIVLGFGVAVGPYLLGMLHDVYDYRVSYLVAAGMSVIGAALFAAAWRSDA